MERTQAHIVDATLAQRDEIRYYIHYLGSIEYPIYSSLVNHIRCESTNKPANTQVKYQIKALPLPAIWQVHGPTYLLQKAPEPEHTGGE